MKARKLLALGLVSMLVLTGCGKKLTCTKTSDSDDMKSTEKIVLKYDSKGEEVKSGTMTGTIKVSDDYKDYLETMKKSFDKSYEDRKGYTASAKISGNTLKVKVSFKTSKMSDDDKKYLGYDNYKDTKADLEDSGYKCK